MTWSFIPAGWLAMKCNARSVRHWQVLLSSTAVLTVAGGLLLFGDVVSPWLHAIQLLCHGGGAFRCPFCGGTSAFLNCCRGYFGEAIRDNAFVTLLWCWTVCEIGLRSAVLAWPWWQGGDRVVCRLETVGEHAFLPMLALSWCIGGIVNLSV